MLFDPQSGWIPVLGRRQRSQREEDLPKGLHMIRMSQSTEWQFSGIRAQRNCRSKCCGPHGWSNCKLVVLYPNQRFARKEHHCESSFNTQEIHPGGAGSEARAKATLKQTVIMFFTMSFCLIQIVALIGQMTITWPSHLESTRSPSHAAAENRCFCWWFPTFFFNHTWGWLS